jgi:hypothetical protein
MRMTVELWWHDADGKTEVDGGNFSDSATWFSTNSTNTDLLLRGLRPATERLVMVRHREDWGIMSLRDVGVQ